MNHVLVVDDDRAIVGTVQAVLVDEGYDVTTAADGREALAELQREMPSLVLLDMRMPVMDGWRFAQEVKQQGLRVPIVVMTAAQDARRWASEIGANGYVSKPFDIDQLLDVVATHRLQHGH
ncbi:MAG TPA: response regulator [Chloroflexota bacterium]|nr:response regulator [Chloroflexota bacterium]